MVLPVADLASALDPVRFAQAAGFPPLADWQRQVLRSTARRLLLCCSRQAGKSSVTALLACHQSLYVPGSLTLLLSPSLRQSSELFRKVLDTYHAVGESVPAESESKLSLELRQGSRVVSLPGSEQTVRGFSAPSLVVVDEAARCDDGLWFSVAPMLATGRGRAICLSTPWGRRGFFHALWTAAGGGGAAGEGEGEGEWERYEVPASEVPHLAPEFLAEQRRLLGEYWYAQEFDCRWLEGESALFRRDDVLAAFSSQVEAWDL
jgi:hypothetical protein